MANPFQLEWNEVIPFCLDWNGHSIPAGMESSFHSGWNGMAISFQPEWNDSIPFRPEWNELSIPAGMDIPIRLEWNATPSIILRNMPPVFVPRPPYSRPPNWGRQRLSEYSPPEWPHHGGEWQIGPY